MKALGRLWAGSAHISVRRAQPAPPRSPRSRRAQPGSALPGLRAQPAPEDGWQLLRPGRSSSPTDTGCAYCSALPLLSVRLFQFPAFWITWGIGTCCTSVFSSEFRRCYNYWGLWWSDSRRNRLPCESRSWKKAERCRAPTARIEGFESPFIPGSMQNSSRPPPPPPKLKSSPSCSQSPARFTLKYLALAQLWKQKAQSKW